MFDLLKNKQIISIMGNTKNAGKTTVLNALVKHCQSHVVLTSIGLDGEDLDQVTHLDKPQIFVKENDYVLTAEDTLKQFSATYKLVKRYDINSSIGQIVLCQITGPGKVLIAGPSKVSDMQVAIDDIKQNYPLKIIIDGAFFRQSFAHIGEGVIFVVGANYSQNMVLTLEQADLNFWKLTLPKYDDSKFDLSHHTHVSIIRNCQLNDLEMTSILGQANHILNQIKSDDILFVPKAITDEFVSCWTNHYNQRTCHLILQSGIHIQLNNQNLKRLKHLTKSIHVIQPIDVLAVCMNPTSPSGYRYPQGEFKKQLETMLNIKVYDVKEDGIYE